MNFKCLHTKNKLKECKSLLGAKIFGQYNNVLTLNASVKLKKFYREMERLSSKKVGASVQAIYPLSPMQEGMLYYYLVDKKSTNYFIRNVFEFTGKLNYEYFDASFQLLALKYDVLRTVFFFNKSEKTRQIVLKKRKLDIRIVDFSNADELEKDYLVEEEKKRDIRRGFDLEKESLLRITLIKLSDQKHTVLWSAHHIIIDGWCISILFRDLMLYYSQLESGYKIEEIIASIEKEKPKMLTYAEYINWLQKQDMQAADDYWKELLSQYSQVSEIKPTCIPDDTEDKVSKVDCSISEEATEKLCSVARSGGFTVSNILEAVLGVLLQRYNRSQDSVFGKVVSGRDNGLRGIEDAVGLFINTIPVRVKSDATSTWREISDLVKSQALNSTNYDFYSLSQIQKHSSVGNDLIQVLYVFENYYINKEELSGSMHEFGKHLIVDVCETREKTNYPLTIVASMGDKLHIEISYDTKIYAKREVEYILSRFTSFICNAIDNFDHAVNDTCILTKKEIQSVLELSRGEEKKYNYVPVTKMIEKSVMEHKDDIAFDENGTTVTYDQFYKSICAAARRLRNIGIGREKFVPIVMDRGLTMVQAIYAVIFAGAAFVPVDASYPVERIEYILNDCCSTVVISDRDIPENNGRKIIRMEQLLYNSSVEEEAPIDIVNELSDAIYMIYTSGSTGKPKGVVIEHHNLFNYLEYGKANYIKNRIIAPLFTNMSFDLTITTLFLTVAAGGKMIVMTGNVAENIDKIFRNKEITFVKLTPSHLKMAVALYDTEKLPALSTLILGGEELETELCASCVDKYNSQLDIHNEYGPTEATVGCCDYIYKRTDSERAVSIGRPIWNANMYILDGNNICGIGMPAELCIGGVGVAREYFGKEQLTSEKFVNSDVVNERIYRSGDLARWTFDGRLEYLGRIDDQVKISGHRIELGEIIKTLKSIDGVTDACVTVDVRAGEKQLFAYYTAEKDVTPDDVKKGMARKLPNYMTPKYVMRLESIPMTANGKVDKNALTPIIISERKNIVKPETEIEEAVADAFKEVLKLDVISMDDNFLELGGDSIMAIRIVSKMRGYGYSVDMSNLMRAVSARDFANLVTKDINRIQCDQEEVSGIIPNTPIISEFLGSDYKKPEYYNQAVMLRIRNGHFNVDSVKFSLEQLSIHHDALRMVCIDDQLSIRTVAESKLYDFCAFNVEIDTPDVITEICTKVQSGIDLREGPLFKAVLICGNSGDYLMLCAHHLVVDGVSWRILLEDFSNLYKGHVQGVEVPLPSKTTSFKQWAEKMHEYAESNIVKSEISYWNEVSSKINSNFEDKYSAQNSDESEIEVSLDKDTTQKLLYASSKAYSTDVTDLLLASLGLALEEYNGSEATSVVLESHGRNSNIEDVIVDRTVGWFTCTYPVVFNNESDLGNMIIGVKDVVHRVPNDGFNYGIIRYIRNEINTAAQADICFNYLGNFDNDNNIDDIEISDEMIGKTSSPDNAMQFKFYIDAFVSSKKMMLRATYKDKCLNSDDAEKLMKIYVDKIEKIVEHCITAKEQIKTATDFNKHLSNEAFREILDIFD